MLTFVIFTSIIHLKEGVTLNLTDLRYSNSLYIFRSIIDKPKTVDEIAKEVKMTKLAVNKILSELISKNLVTKIKNIKANRGGRPNVYYGLNGYYFTALISCDSGNLDLYYFSPNYNNTVTKFDTIKNIDGFEIHAAAYTLGFIGKNNEKCLQKIITGDKLERFVNTDDALILTIDDILINAYSDEEKAVFIEYDNGKILINHSKPRIVKSTKEEISKILDIDVYCDLRGKNNEDVLFIAMQKFTTKLIETKI